ncbi:MAG: lauroyl acyltransferase [Candidatus Pelagadaptatus aseana]|uniref:lysophospholipid acyltransferase family protein n=1 Tax=Candidatus Pelagadaptatus aseana TaxID=3120508 RepID=UPI0039B15256
MDIKSRIVLSVLWLLSFLTLGGARRFGAFIGWLLRVTNSQTYKVTRKNIELCYPSLPEVEREKIVRGALFHAGCTAAEAGIAWAASERQLQANDKLITNVINEELLFAGLDKGKGVLLLMPHYGNWELFASYIPRRIGVGVAMYKSAKMPLLDQRMRESRELSGFKLLAAGRKGVIDFMKAYRQGQTCIILPDQQVSEKSGVWSSFFGIPAITTKFVHYLIKKNPEGVVLVTHVKRIESGFEIRFSEPEAGIFDDDLQASTDAMNQSFEKKIDADGTEQYQWSYKRFKKNPEKHYRNL